LPTGFDMARIGSMDRGDLSFPVLPLIALFDLILFYFVWAAMHDIAHGDEGTLEWTVLAMCAMAFPLLYWLASRILTQTANRAWLIGTALLITLFCVGAVGSMVHPKYPKDPMLGMTFLSVGVPTLGVIGYHLLREVRNRRA
jgi:hypothetical protein